MITQIYIVDFWINLYILCTFQEDGIENKEKHGEFVLEIADGSLFAVVGYGSDASLAYVCLESNRAALFHAGNNDFKSSF